jgi:formylglycine-generating enzyme required for sulfatase activity
MASYYRADVFPTTERFDVGFRVATIVPEPSAILLLISGVVGALLIRRRLPKAAIILCGSCSCFTLVSDAAETVTIPTVSIGDPGNPSDTEIMTSDQTTGYGSVAYSYRIGATEITNSQYVEFLNAVASTDPYGLYNPRMGTDTWGGIIRSGSAGNYTYAVKSDAIGRGPSGTDYSYANKAVGWTTWFDAIRFTNWLHNGQGSGDTEDGVYTLLGGTPTPSNSDSITRNAGARWFLPTEDEWYKAAFYDGTNGVYYNYPTGDDAAPDNKLPAADTGNSANYGNPTRNGSYPLLDAGAYTLSATHYGTFDQGGSLWEWNESAIISQGSYGRGQRGCAWFCISNGLAAWHRFRRDPAYDNDGLGFRVAAPADLATLPDPANNLVISFDGIGAQPLVLNATSLTSRGLIGQVTLAPNTPTILPITGFALNVGAGFNGSQAFDTSRTLTINGVSEALSQQFRLDIVNFNQVTFSAPEATALTFDLLEAGTVEVTPLGFSIFRGFSGTLEATLQARVVYIPAAIPEPASLAIAALAVSSIVCRAPFYRRH